MAAMQWFAGSFSANASIALQSSAFACKKFLLSKYLQPYQRVGIVLNEQLPSKGVSACSSPCK
jgi:hypothetical protein